MSNLLKEIWIYQSDVSKSKESRIPRLNVGFHLSYENKIRKKDNENILRFHLENRLFEIPVDRNYVRILTDNIRKDFQNLAVLLVTDSALEEVSIIEGITNFQKKTGKRYGFHSEEIINNDWLRILFDNRIEKPGLVRNLFSAPPIRRFWISREEFLEKHLKQDFLQRHQEGEPLSSIFPTKFDLQSY